MTAQRVVPGPDGTRFSSITHVVETGSTNADLLVEAADGAAEGTVRVADHQSAGRGRQARVWHDEPGNSMLMSVLLRPTPSLAPLIPLLAGLAVGDGIAATVGALDSDAPPVALKWPNDVLVPSMGERKLAGVLAEATAEGSPDGRLAVVVGTGLNLRWGTPPPPDIAQRAATLEELAGEPVERWRVVAAVLSGFEHWLTVAERQGDDGGIDAVLDMYRGRCCTLDRAIRLQRPADVIEGIAVAIADSGALVVDTVDGLVEVTAGDTHHL